MNTLKRACLLLIIAVCLTAPKSSAVILYGTGDTNANTTPPTGPLADSGWQYQGLWGSFTGTPIAPNYFITARHVGGSVGGSLMLDGIPYVTTAYWDDTGSDLRIWRVLTPFPRYAPLYIDSDELGKLCVVMGRGTQRGNEVYVTAATPTYTTQTVNLKTLGITKKEALKLYSNPTFRGNEMTYTVTTYTTNTTLRGWRFGPSDRVLRWGINFVVSAGAYILADFSSNDGPDECYLSPGDSSGGIFIQGSDGSWRLAAINYGIDGPYSFTGTDTPFYCALFDISGLFDGSVQMPSDGRARPMYWYATRISTRIPWIKSVISQ